MRPGAGIALVIAIVSVWTGAAPAQPRRPAVALILEVRGTTDPPLKAYRELRVGDTVVLDRQARLVVLRYPLARETECRTLTIEGGVVSVPRPGELNVEHGVASARDTKCVQRHEATTAAGAYLLRAALPLIGTEPALIISGARADEVSRLRVLVRAAGSGDRQERRIVVESPVNGPEFRWPPTLAPLHDGQGYVFEFLARNGAVLGSVLVVASSTASSREATSVFAVE